VAEEMKVPYITKADSKEHKEFFSNDSIDKKSDSQAVKTHKIRLVMMAAHILSSTSIR